jgi:hypothetical protein
MHGLWKHIDEFVFKSSIWVAYAFKRSGPPSLDIATPVLVWLGYGAFTFDVKSMLNENLGGILGATQC